MGFEECPFRFLTLEERNRHGHFGVCECRAEGGAEAAVRQVALGCERGEHWSFGAEVESSFFRGKQWGILIHGTVFSAGN